MTVRSTKRRLICCTAAALALLPATALSGPEYICEVVLVDDVCLVNNGREAIVHTFSNDNRLVFNFTPYFRSHGIAPSDVLILRHPSYIPVGTDTLTVIDGSTDICGNEDFTSGLYVRTNNHSIINALTAVESVPVTVFLSPTLHIENRLMLLRHYEALGCKVHDLALGPVAIPIAR